MFFYFASFLSAFIMSLFLGKIFIKNADCFRSAVRDWTPQSHKKKNNTPTMGGIFLIISAIIPLLFFVPLSVHYFWIFLLCIISFASIGFLDDWCKIHRKKGISARTKFIFQWLSALIVASLLVFWIGLNSTVTIPLINYSINLGIGYIVWASFVIVACSNAVNLTDGLDGLAASILIPNLLFFSTVTTISGIAFYQSLSTIGFTLAGATTGFLWYNRYPAQVFMGDVGSLSLGAAYSLLALILKLEFLIPIVGIIFLFEELSVMLQVFLFKYFKKRMFKMAPLHHHFELSGWSELSITFLFTSLTVLFCSILLIVIFLF